MQSTKRDLIATFTVPGEPRSKNQKKYRNASGERVTYPGGGAEYGEAFRALVSTPPDPGYTAYAVEATFFYEHHQRRDVDNMLKGVLDGLNGVAWVDDNQVLSVTASKVYVSSGEARTEVTVYRVGEMPWEYATCVGCGDRYRTYTSWIGTRKYCSETCLREHRRQRRSFTCEHCGLEVEAHGPVSAGKSKFCSMDCKSKAMTRDVVCDICGTQFTKPQSWVKARNYCSNECRRVQDAIAHKERRSKYYPGTCAICGTGTTRKEYRRCNPCKLAGKELIEDDSHEYVIGPDHRAGIKSTTPHVVVTITDLEDQ